MSDWVKNNKYTVIFLVLILTVFFFSVIKPYVDSSDRELRESMNNEIIIKLEEISKINGETLIELRKITIPDSLKTK